MLQCWLGERNCLASNDVCGDQWLRFSKTPNIHCTTTFALLSSSIERAVCADVQWPASAQSCWLGRLRTRRRAGVRQRCPCNGLIGQSIVVFVRLCETTWQMGTTDATSNAYMPCAGLARWTCTCARAGVCSCADLSGSMPTPFGVSKLQHMRAQQVLRCLPQRGTASEALEVRPNRDQSVLMRLEQLGEDFLRGHQRHQTHVEAPLRTAKHCAFSFISDMPWQAFAHSAPLVRFLTLDAKRRRSRSRQSPPVSDPLGNWCGILSPLPGLGACLQARRSSGRENGARGELTAVNTLGRCLLFLNRAWRSTSTSRSLVGCNIASECITINATCTTKVAKYTVIGVCVIRVSLH